MTFTVGTILTVAIAIAYARKLPSYIPTCSRDDPDLNSCFIRATETVKPYLIKGIPALKIPPIDPLVLPELKLEQGTGAVNYKITFTDFTLINLKSYKFTKTKIDVNNLKIDCSIEVGQLDVQSGYKINGQILVAPITGSGHMNTTYASASVRAHMDAELVEKNGENYIKIVNTDLHLKLGDATIYFDNLFNSDENLGRITNQFLNENSKELVKEVTPAIETAIAAVIQDVANKVYLAAPYDEVFPPGQ